MKKLLFLGFTVGLLLLYGSFRQKDIPGSLQIAPTSIPTPIVTNNHVQIPLQIQHPTEFRVNENRERGDE
ncbi:MAG: hypothetical protein KGJ07_03465 [Patescibacteria group bacterium]|nr:hypothetical protein [Patescibacteria group bacterium]MDE2588508.1 hypothetical protein [Patescibacteria group bacterium]